MAGSPASWRSLLQQVSLSAGYLATSVATVSVSNPIVSVALGTLLFDERLSRPAWHVFVAVCGLGARDARRSRDLDRP